MQNKLIISVLVAILVIQFAAIAVLYTQSNGNHRHIYVTDATQSFVIPYSAFNHPISNGTRFELNPGYNASWIMVVRSSLGSSRSVVSESQIAIAPEYPIERLAIPTIIVQERADGLLRVEYFAQDWPHTYGLVLYNSTAPGWSRNQNVTIRFVSFGPPSAVNPQLAPRPNGNVTVMIGRDTVLSDYPIAWANLSSVYIYGYPGSSFDSGSISINFYGLKPKG